VTQETPLVGTSASAGIGLAPVLGLAQELARTQSRRTGPRRWRRAVQWTIGASVHRSAGETTVRVAEDLARRMDYTTGHVRYGLDATAARLGISRATVARHIAVLREMGLLVWVEHGTRSNSRRRQGLDGYAGTATVYAAVIPPAYDHAMGHEVRGTGYEARVAVDHRCTPEASEDTKGPNDGEACTDRVAAVDNRRTGLGETGRETPSLTVVKEVGQVEVDGGSKYTSHARRPHTTAPAKSTKRRRTGARTGRSPLQVAQDIRIARLVRALVPWAQRERRTRRLAYVLRPLIDRGLDAYAIAAVLTGWCSGMRWRPELPAVFITAQLHREAQQEQAAKEQATGRTRWEHEHSPVGPLQATPEQQAAVLAGLREGLDRYKRTVSAVGWDDLSTTAATFTHHDDDQAEASALVDAFLAGSLA
jgi:AraC-like DNA-binding protein